MPQNIRNTLIYLIFIYFLGFGAQHLKAEETFQEEDNCLAYKTEETILLLIDSTVIGKTCEISAMIESEDENTRIVVSFPIKSLDSGIDMRDKDVTEMLSGESNNDIRFISDFMTRKQIGAALTKGNMKLSGMLEFAGKSFKLIFPLQISDKSGTWLITGKLITSLSKFGLELPSVLGGFLANTHDYLELLVHLRIDSVQGLAKLRARSFNQ